MTYFGRDKGGLAFPPFTEVPRLVAEKTPDTVGATGALFNIYGTVKITDIVGRVVSAIQNQACTLRLGLVMDSLAEVFMCAASGSVASFTVGSMLSITGVAATAMTATTSVAAALSQASPWTCTATTSGIIRLTTSATNTGRIRWTVLYIPLTNTSLIVPA